MKNTLITLASVAILTASVNAQTVHIAITGGDLESYNYSPSGLGSQTGTITNSYMGHPTDSSSWYDDAKNNVYAVDNNNYYRRAWDTSTGTFSGAWSNLGAVGGTFSMMFFDDSTSTVYGVNAADALEARAWDSAINNFATGSSWAVTQAATGTGGSDDGAWFDNGTVYVQNIGGSGIYGRSFDSASGTLTGGWNLLSTSAATANSAFAAPVPEPSSTALLGLGALGLLVRRKR